MIRQSSVARSPLDRVLGGLCGGLGAYLGVNPWWLRVGAIVLAVLSGGVAALLYLLLWWVVPLDDPLRTAPGGRGIGTLLGVGLALVLAGALVAARGLGVLSGPSGADLFWPLVIVAVGLVLFWREIRA
ncbi:MAG: hypothetical protein Kow0077_17790 [Anaerolineae bacterium]